MKQLVLPSQQIRNIDRHIQIQVYTYITFKKFYFSRTILIFHFLFRHKVSLRELRVRDELNIPLPAALVELSSMEQCSTPLDR